MIEATDKNVFDYEGTTATNYMEAILYMLRAARPADLDQNSLKSLLESYNYEIRKHQSTSAISNLLRHGLISKIDGKYGSPYVVHLDQVEKFCKYYKRGAVPLWYDHRRPNLLHLEITEPKEIEGSDFRYNGMQAGNYMAAIFCLLISKKIEKIDLFQLKEMLDIAGLEILESQVHAAMKNLFQLDLLEKTSIGFKKLCIIDLAKLENYYSKVIKGEKSLWYYAKRHKKQTHKATVTQHTQRRLITSVVPDAKIDDMPSSFICRLIFATRTKPIISNEMIKIAKKELNCNLTASAPRNFLTNYTDVIDRRGHHHGRKGFDYTANKMFFEKYAVEKHAYIYFYPEKKELILSRFKGHEIDINRFDVIKKSSYAASAIIRAIFAAYHKPLTLRHVQAIAKKYNYTITDSIIYYFRSHNKDLLSVVGDRSGKGIPYCANAQFFEKFAKEIDLFIEILPAKRDDILKRFNQYNPDAVKHHHASIPPAAPVLSTDTNNAPAPVISDDHGAVSENGQIEDMSEGVAAANVGASIIAYIADLKSKLNTKRTTEQIQGEAKKRIETLTATIAGLKAERDNLSFKHNKLAQIVEEKDRRIAEMQDIVTKANFRLEKSEKPKSFFKMGEVASMTKLIKGNIKLSSTDKKQTEHVK